IVGPTAADWIALVAVGAATSTRPAWQYTTGAAAGTISFAVPGSVTPGSYEFRLLANNSLTLLATSSPVTVTAGSGGGGPTVSAASSSFAAGTSVHVSWSGIVGPTAADWIALVAVGAATST